MIDKFFRYQFILLGLVALLMIGCTSKGKLLYLQPTRSDESPNSTIFGEEDYRLRPNDNLYIRVLSIDNVTKSLFNVSPEINYATDASIELNSIRVNSDGMMEFPFLGEIKVVGMTVQEVKKIIEKKIADYADQCVIVVKLVNKNITVLGEVNKPGRYIIYRDKITIFDAIGYAGDITDYGNKKHVKVIRETPKGSVVSRLDLTKDDLLASPSYYVSNNDIVYIEPRNRVFGTKSLSVNVFVYTLSTAAIMYTAFKN